MISTQGELTSLGAAIREVKHYVLEDFQDRGYRVEESSDGYRLYEGGNHTGAPAARFYSGREAKALLERVERLEDWED